MNRWFPSGTSAHYFASMLLFFSETERRYAILHQFSNFANTAERGCFIPALRAVFQPKMAN